MSLKNDTGVELLGRIRFDLDFLVEFVKIKKVFISLVNFRSGNSFETVHPWK